MSNVNESINLDKHWELVNFCEFDKYATKSYCAIHNVDESLNLGDITKVDETKLKPFNMICGGSPCQDFSVAGKQKGSVWTCKDCGHEYNPLTVYWSKRDKCPQCNSSNIEKTRSSLLVEYLRVIRANKPNFGIYENVKNIVGKQFRDTTFKLFEDELHEYGYNTYWKVLNAKNYGIPQNRERVYLIFIRKDLDNGQFKFPEPFDNGIRLKDILEDEVDEKFYLSADKVQKFLSNFNQSELPVTTRNSDTVSTIRAAYYKNGERNVYENIENGNGYEGIVESNNVKQIGNISEGNSSWGNPQTGRVYSAEGISPTLNTCGGGQREPKIVCGIDKSNNHPSVIDNANCITSREDRGVSNRKKEGTAVLECPETSYCIDANYYKGTSPEEYVKKHRRQLVFEENTIKIPQATKQGYIECEVGGVADLSYPNSKTRRGRVQENGTISPTITATETGICRIERTDGCSFTKYINCIMECLDLMNLFGGNLNEKRYKTIRKILYVLWEEIRKEKIQWQTRGLWCIQKKKILQPRLYDPLSSFTTESRCDMENCSSNSTKNQSTDIETVQLRNMWEEWQIRCSSYKLELEGQFLEEFTSFMSELSQQNSQNQRCMLDMWGTDERTRVLQQALLTLQEIWMSFNDEEKQQMSKLSSNNRKSEGMCQIRIRKLTPKETWRLMGFSDRDFDAAKNAGISNSQLYKQAGNSIVVDVLYYIYVELYKAMPYLFEDLKLTSFFSGIGAFEVALDRLYEGINSGNFINPQVE